LKLKNSTQVIFFLLFLSWVQPIKAQLDSAQYYKENHDYFKALNFYEEWVNSTSDTLSDTWFEANLDLAKCYRLNGQFTEGLQAFEIGIRRAAQNKNNYFELKYSIYLADYFIWIDELEALKYINKVNEDKLVDYPDLQVIYLHRRAAVYNVLYHFFKNNSYMDTAIVLANKSLFLAKEINFKDAQATCLNELAHLYQSIGNYTLALSYYDSSSTIFREENRLIEYVNVRNNLAGLYLSMNKADQVPKVLEEPIEIAKQYGWLDQLYPMYHTKRKYFLSIGDSVNYYKTWVLASEMYNQIVKKRSKLDLLKLQTQFDVVEKEKNIELKNQQLTVERNRRIGLIVLVCLLVFLITIVVVSYVFKKRDADKLSILLNENQFLLGESNHRIKNNLQLIVSLLARETFGKKGTEISKLQEISAKIESIATLHQQLYTNDDKLTINLNNYLSEIFENFRGFLEPRNISLETNFKAKDVSIEKAMHLGLLVVELLINSLKYAFIKENEKPQINFEIAQDTNSVWLKYTDNGVGLKEGAQPKLIGLLVQQLKGKSAILNEKGFVFSLKLKY
jgi:two-component sensor histidine kinase